MAAGTERGNEVLAHVAARAGVAMAANVLSFGGLSPFIGHPPGGRRRRRWRRCGSPTGRRCSPSPATRSRPRRPRRPAPANVVEHTPEVAAADLVARVVSVEEPEPDLSGALKSARGRGRRRPRRRQRRRVRRPARADRAAATASLGVSRVVTSLGWRPHHEQVGQTGSRISPDLYIPCGISGAIQHWAGLLERQEHPGDQHRRRRADGHQGDVRRDRRPARGGPGDQRGDPAPAGLTARRPSNEPGPADVHPA